MEVEDKTKMKSTESVFDVRKRIGNSPIFGSAMVNWTEEQKLRMGFAVMTVYRMAVSLLRLESNKGHISKAYTSFENHNLIEANANIFHVYNGISGGPTFEELNFNAHEAPVNWKYSSLLFKKVLPIIKKKNMGITPGEVLLDEERLALGESSSLPADSFSNIDAFALTYMLAPCGITPENLHILREACASYTEMLEENLKLFCSPFAISRLSYVKRLYGSLLGKIQDYGLLSIEDICMSSIDPATESLAGDPDFVMERSRHFVDEKAVVAQSVDEQGFPRSAQSVAPEGVTTEEAESIPKASNKKGKNFFKK